MASDARDSSSTLFSTQALPTDQRLALQIEYDGSPYAGWQAQPQLPHVNTVQSCLEAALGQIANTTLRVFCAGRTDTGVHATSQWVHFIPPVARSAKAWVVGANAQLPDSIRIVDLQPVDAQFHARHSATARRYDYLIANMRTAPALLANRVLWVRDPLDADAMDRALQVLLGERDFSAFRAASCQSTTPMRFLEAASVRRHGEFLRLRVTANAFLHHMVRNLVGSALEVGLHRQSDAWLSELLAGRDRRVAAATASPQGLYLTGVRYPDYPMLSEGRGLAFFPDD